MNQIVNINNPQLRHSFTGESLRHSSDEGVTLFIYMSEYLGIKGIRKKHGLMKDEAGKKTRLYHIWEDMKARCFNPNCNNYKRYGARGITVCAEWASSYASFHQWAVANGYLDSLTIDRFPNNNGNYEPSNCRWATKDQQDNNRRTNVFITFNGETKTLTQWAETLNTNSNSIKKRLKLGWTLEETLTIPFKKCN